MTTKNTKKTEHKTRTKLVGAYFSDEDKLRIEAYCLIKKTTAAAIVRRLVLGELEEYSSRQKKAAQKKRDAKKAQKNEKAV